MVAVSSVPSIKPSCSPHPVVWLSRMVILILSPSSIPSQGSSAPEQLRSEQVTAVTTSTQREDSSDTAIVLLGGRSLATERRRIQSDTGGASLRRDRGAERRA